MNSSVEAVGFALVLGFLWFIWPPLVLLGAGVLLIAWANTRTRQGRLGRVVGAAAAAARRAYAAADDPEATTELRRVV